MTKQEGFAGKLIHGLAEYIAELGQTFSLPMLQFVLSELGINVEKQDPRDFHSQQIEQFAHKYIASYKTFHPSALISGVVISSLGKEFRVLVGEGILLSFSKQLNWAEQIQDKAEEPTSIIPDEYWQEAKVIRQFSKALQGTEAAAMQRFELVDGVVSEPYGWYATMLRQRSNRQTNR